VNTAASPPVTTTTVIVARVNAHLARRGLSATGLARAMGRSHTWLLRKLDPNQAEGRPIMLEDLDTVAAHLGITGAELLAPCLTEAEAGALAWLRTGLSVGTRADLVHPEAVDALIAQGLALEAPDGHLSLTPLAA
jgi:hypothetical protein